MQIIDGDGHIMEEPNDIWTVDRIDHDRWGDWVPRKEVIDEIYEITYMGGTVRGGGRELHDQMAAAVGMTPRQFHDLLATLRRPGGHEPNARIEDLDVDGIDAVVLYPSLAMFFGPVDEIPAFRDTEFVAACLRAYNDWLADFCATHPSRLFGVAAVPLQDVPRAVAEVQHATSPRPEGRVRTAVRLRRRAAAEPSRVRPVLVGVPGGGCTGRLPSRGARRHAGCVPQVRPGARDREHDDLQHGDGRDPRRFRVGSGRRQHRRHGRDDGPPVDGRRVRTVP